MKTNFIGISNRDGQKSVVIFLCQRETSETTLLHLPANHVPREVSEPLFQSSSQKTSLVQGIVFVGEFDFIATNFRMAVRVWFRFIAINTLLTSKILDLQQDVGQ